jgi:hypothetical protein
VRCRGGKFICALLGRRFYSCVAWTASLIARCWTFVRCWDGEFIRALLGRRVYSCVAGDSYVAGTAS